MMHEPRCRVSSIQVRSTFCCFAVVLMVLLPRNETSGECVCERGEGLKGLACLVVFVLVLCAVPVVKMQIERNQYVNGKAQDRFDVGYINL